MSSLVDPSSHRDGIMASTAAAAFVGDTTPLHHHPSSINIHSQPPPLLDGNSRNGANRNDDRPHQYASYHIHDHNNHYRMERVLYNLHRQLCLSALQNSSRKTRTAVEHVVLILAVLCFGVLLLVHRSFVYRETSSSIGSTSNATLLSPVREMAAALPTTGHNSRCLLRIPGFRRDADVTHLSLVLHPPDLDDCGSSNGSGEVQRRRRRSSSFAYIVDPGGTDDERDLDAGNGSCPNHEQQREQQQQQQQQHNLQNQRCIRKDAGVHCVEGAAAANVTDPLSSFSSSLSSSPSEIYYSYSPVKGYLLLPEHLQREKHLAVQHVVVSAHDPACFGEPFLGRLVWTITGVETVLANWFLVLALESGGGGYLLNPRSGRSNIVDLEQLYGSEAGIVLRNRSSRWRKWRRSGTSFSESSRSNRNSSSSSPSLLHQLLSKLMVVVKTSFLFFIITTLVSFTLRETQERMIDFTYQLRELYAQSSSNNNNNTGSNSNLHTTPAPHTVQRVVSLRPGVVAWQVAPLVARHLAENLLFVPIMIGMIFFLIEFYRGDKFLAFMVVSLVWLCEVFTVISLRSSQGLHFFPRIFFLLFSLFHFYLFLYPFGFIYTALASTALFMTHSVLFFWHRYELPAVAHGLVTLEHPRMRPHPGSLPGAPAATGMETVYSYLDRSVNSSNYGGPTPPGIPNILLPARRTATPILLRYPPPPIHPNSHHASTVLFSPPPDPASGAGEGAVGGLSRPESSVVLVRGLDEDDDDNSSSASSYLYFMDGEVVVHRRAQHHHSRHHQHIHHHPHLIVQQQRHMSREVGGTSAHSTFSGDEADAGYESASSFSLSQHHQFHPPQDRLVPPLDVVPDDAARSSLRGIMEGFEMAQDRPVGGLGPMLDDRSVRAVFGPTSNGAATQSASSSRRRDLFVAPSEPSHRRDSREDPPEVSSLQAILFRNEDRPGRVGSRYDETARTSASPILAAATDTSSMSEGGTSATSTTVMEGTETTRTTPRSDNRSSSSSVVVVVENIDARENPVESGAFGGGGEGASSSLAPSVPRLDRHRQ